MKRIRYGIIVGIGTIWPGQSGKYGSDPDLRPRYEPIDALKYDVVMCPICGYAALSRFFQLVTMQQAKNIKEMICIHFTSQDLDNIYKILFLPQ